VFMTRLVTVYPREIKRSDVASVKCCIGERNLASLSRQICVVEIYTCGFRWYTRKHAQTYVIANMFKEWIISKIKYNKHDKHNKKINVRNRE